ncbi:hypothetical protein BpHYR1_038625 [Brachionus plicatilis]|uniref:Secreted protein n=1 Tax=Brachionus plicatilis TaxID=10195 RepID=A0A3M7STG8_BRAPC|nr:hypothetical protein BpHYR1_038625 [Brachionus plicatilis]
MPFSSIMSWRLSCIPLHLWTLYFLALTLSCKSVDGGCWKRCSSSFVNKYALKSLDFLMCFHNKKVSNSKIKSEFFKKEKTQVTEKLSVKLINQDVNFFILVMEFCNQ